MLSEKAIMISHLLQIDRSREGKTTLKNGIYLGDGSIDVRFVRNAIIIHICIAKGVRRNLQFF
uniref:Uncharacterized protein n=1 Tax=Rhizophagus irregularis (strain DAOM 181602 / DAOM 197198 / MUCL 43194) TaxID=747089 RepID=U9U0B9_RHIID